MHMESSGALSFVNPWIPTATLDMSLLTTTILPSSLNQHNRKPELSLGTNFSTRWSKHRSRIICRTRWWQLHMDSSFKDTIRKNWHLLGSPGTRVVHQIQIIYSNRRPKNLKDHLVRAQVSLPKPTLWGLQQAP